MDRRGRRQHVEYHRRHHRELGDLPSALFSTSGSGGTINVTTNAIGNPGSTTGVSWAGVR